MSKWLIALMIGVTMVATPVGVKQYTKAQEDALWQREKTIMEGQLPKHITYYENRSPRVYLQELDAIANYFVITEHEMASFEPTRARVMKLRWELHNSTALQNLPSEEKRLLDRILWTWEESDWTIMDSQHDAISLLQQKYSRDTNFNRGVLYEGTHGYAKGFKDIKQPHWEPMHNPEVQHFED